MKLINLTEALIDGGHTQTCYKDDVTVIEYVRTITVIV
jgi:hypothetical protein